MKKFIIMSDFHLKTSDHLGKIILDEGLNSRLLDRITKIKIVVDRAVEEDIESIFILGDIFDRLNPVEILKKSLIEALSQALIHDIKVYILLGNHDTDLNYHNLMGEQQLITSILGADAEAFVVVSEPTILKGKLIKGLPVLLLPWLGSERMVAVIKDLKEPHFIMTHLEARGAQIQEYQTKCAPVDPDDIKEHIIVSGHMHKYQKIRSNWTYVGSIQRMDFAEAGDKKGYLFGNGADIDFVELPDKQLVTLDVSPEYNQYGFLDRIPEMRDNYILRVIFNGPEDWYAGLDRKRIKTVLLDKGAHKIFTKFENTDLKNLRNPEITIDSEFEEAVRIYCKKKEREDLTELGLKILKEVESIPI